MPEEKYMADTSPIPKIFYSDKTDQAFSSCKMCNKDLISSGEPYLIEKAYGKNALSSDQELVFEIAYCMNCLHEVHSTLSIESKEKIQNYFATNTQMDQRDAELKKYKLFDADIWLHNCIVKNKSMDEVNEFQIYALCQGQELVFNHAPYMVCGEAVDEIADLLSNKSLDILNDLMADIIDLPPEFGELFKTRTPLII